MRERCCRGQGIRGRHTRRCKENAHNPSLLDFGQGVKLIIKHIAPWIPCAPRLRELGILEGSSVMILKQTDPLLILAQDSRIALDLETADGIEAYPAESA